ncbi:MAG: hypothetical protein H6850_03105 [Alphaproteobacteria bacterium]|nr:MAG: hypothetical protein H6850_03105 [Alphaproteobacteria bacterium]
MFTLFFLMPQPTQTALLKTEVLKLQGYGKITNGLIKKIAANGELEIKNSEIEAIDINGTLYLQNVIIDHLKINGVLTIEAGRITTVLSNGDFKATGTQITKAELRSKEITIKSSKIGKLIFKKDPSHRQQTIYISRSQIDEIILEDKNAHIVQDKYSDIKKITYQ